MFRRPLLSLLLAASVAAGASATLPQAVLAAGCPKIPVSIEDLVALQRTPGPLATSFGLGVTPMNERALACFGRRELTVSAYVNQPDGIGGTTSYTLTPEWIVAGSLIVFGSSREISPGYGDGSFFFISIPPRFGELQDRYARRWVTIRGHFNDANATSCSASGPVGATPTTAQAVAICRTMFVLSSIRTSAPPDTATGPSTADDASNAVDARAAVVAKDAWPTLGWVLGLGWLIAAMVAPWRRRHDPTAGTTDDREQAPRGA
ncbi:MAG: hypothetical protein ABIZ72_07720 [Candidatus Limnocylindrales bacterium]